MAGSKSARFVCRLETEAPGPGTVSNWEKSSPVESIMSYHDHGLYASASRRTNDNDVVLEEELRLASRKYARGVQKMAGYEDVKFTEFKVWENVEGVIQEVGEEAEALRSRL